MKDDTYLLIVKYLVWTRIYEEKFLVKIIEKYILLGQKLGQASILHQNLPCFFVSNFFNI